MSSFRPEPSKTESRLEQAVWSKKSLYEELKRAADPQSQPDEEDYKKKERKPRDPQTEHIPDTPENQGVIEFLKKAPKQGLWQPLGKEVKCMKCFRCGNYGHRTGDRECPLLTSGNQNTERFHHIHEDPMAASVAARSEERAEKEARVEEMKRVLAMLEERRKRKKKERKEKKRKDKKEKKEKKSKKHKSSEDSKRDTAPSSSDRTDKRDSEREKIHSASSSSSSSRRRSRSPMDRDRDRRDRDRDSRDRDQDRDTSGYRSERRDRVDDSRHKSASSASSHDRK